MTTIPPEIAAEALRIAQQHATHDAQRRHAAKTWGTPLTMQQHLHPDYRTTPALQLLDQEITHTLGTPDSRLIISMPPQEGKTELVRAAVTAQLTRNPDTRVVLGSYNQSLASLGGRAVRDNIARHPELGLTLDQASHSRSEWGITGHRGGVVSRGRGAGVSGRAADLLIIDDPLKEGEAPSQTIRDECWLWWQEGLATRLSPGAPVIVIMTRWHHDDLAGRLTRHDAHAGWRTINIPAQCDAPDTDPLGRAAGEYMISARGRTHEQWEQRRRTAGSHTWHALYQGHPTATEGGIIHRDWLRAYTTPLWQERGDGTCWTSGMDQLLISADLAFKGDRTSDYVAIGVWAARGPDAFLLDQVRGHMDFPATVDAFRRVCVKWPQATLRLVEDKANGPALIASLGRQIPGIVGYQPRESKTARCRAWAPLAESGHVWVPDPQLAPWVGDYVEELAAFPAGVHDDQVDQTSMALDRLILRPLWAAGRVITDDSSDADYQISVTY